MSHTTGTIGESEQAAVGERNIQQSIRVTNGDLMIQVELIRAQIGRMESAILTINTTRDRLWFAIVGLILVVVIAFYTLDRYTATLYQDIKDLERKIELLERRVSLVD
jgi:hypothetical protein